MNSQESSLSILLVYFHYFLSNSLSSVLSWEFDEYPNQYFHWCCFILHKKILLPIYPWLSDALLCKMLAVRGSSCELVLIILAGAVPVRSHPMWALVWVLAASSSIQLPWGYSRGWFKCLGSCTHFRRPACCFIPLMLVWPSSRYWSFCGANQQIENLSLHFFIFLCNAAFEINISKKMYTHFIW